MTTILYQRDHSLHCINSGTQKQHQIHHLRGQITRLCKWRRKSSNQDADKSTYKRSQFALQPLHCTAPPQPIQKWQGAVLMYHHYRGEWCSIDFY
ncbi:hypothetical protein VIGAN_02186100 [Vigna angularis var. angularis]|uniref:Uncharacterized protein n=1 Tax=Vigna angularis var. angularis TaxID=157739 RepID=A0A0S3REZ0_PHAAN|nr:hypothetical protein VIGAN_02186100 [Vigna angularis var. angularis]